MKLGAGLWILAEVLLVVFQPATILKAVPAGGSTAQHFACDLGKFVIPPGARPLSSPTREKSTAVTRQPRSASQTVLRPSPAARSIARPGGRSASSAATN